MLSQSYEEIFRLDPSLKYLLGGLDWESYKKLLHRAIVGDHDPKHVILMEIDPLHQKTLPDFLLTEKLLGIKTVAITDVHKVGKFLFYENAGKRTPIMRIYNRAIVDEMVRKDLKLAFQLTDDLEVEWAGHPNWFFRMSKFSLPYLKHECVPKTWFLDRVEQMPKDLEHFVVKPLFSFAGLGVIINVTPQDLAAIPREKRSQYILQERMNFEPVVETPFGGNKMEVRVMYIWLDELLPVMTIIRMGRGLMMGVEPQSKYGMGGILVGILRLTTLECAQYKLRLGGDFARVEFATKNQPLVIPKPGVSARNLLLCQQRNSRFLAR